MKLYILQQKDWGNCWFDVYEAYDSHLVNEFYIVLKTKYKSKTYRIVEVI